MLDPGAEMNHTAPALEGLKLQLGGRKGSNSTTPGKEAAGVCLGAVGPHSAANASPLRCQPKAPGCKIALKS